ncbi:MAG: hypothetical protein P4L36_02585 [Holophaga sp.]|nr:hypothetical protein [Holophaga sp.]
MPLPSSILLLHGLGGSGLGSVRLLEERLQAGGWSSTAFLRPTLQAVHQPAEGKPLERVFVQAWDEMNAFLGPRVPHLTVGFSFGGLLAAYAPSPLRLSICAPWAELSADAIQKATVRPGWRVLQGNQDTVVPSGPNLAVLPDSIPLTIDPKGTHDFDAWMDRIADWVNASWDAFQES